MSLSWFLYTNKMAYFILTSICLCLKYKAKVNGFYGQQPYLDISQFLDKIFYREHLIGPTAQPHHICQLILYLLSCNNIRIICELSLQTSSDAPDMHLPRAPDLDSVVFAV